jgi:hypothetical protein
MGMRKPISPKGAARVAPGRQRGNRFLIYRGCSLIYRGCSLNFPMPSARAIARFLRSAIVSGGGPMVRIHFPPAASQERKPPSRGTVSEPPRTAAPVAWASGRRQERLSPARLSDIGKEAESAWRGPGAGPGAPPQSPSAASQFDGPALRYFEAIAPLTAISISASSKTMNGALLPNSSDSFWTVPAHCSIKQRVQKFAALTFRGLEKLTAKSRAGPSLVYQ